MRLAEIPSSTAGSSVKVPNGVIISFFTGILAFYFVPIGGQLYISDVFCLSVAVLCLLSGQFNPLAKAMGAMGSILLVFAAAWFIQQVTTDLIRQTAFDNLVRGWSKIIVFISCLIAVSVVTKLKMERIIVCACGFAMGKMIETAVFPNEFTKYLPWKFGYSVPVTILVIAYFSYFHRRQRIVLLPAAFIALGVINIVMNFRSMFLFCLISAAACFFSDFGKFFSKNGRPSPLYVPLVIVAIAFTAFSAKTGYEYAAGNGILGAEAQQKYYNQNSGDLNVLQAGRNESLVSTVAIQNSPLIGYGSWAKDHDYAVMQIELLRQKHIEAQYMDDGSEELIPTHSYILGAWVEAGIVGAAFWFVAFLVTLGALLATIESGGKFMGLNFFLFINLLWNIPFSPFGADTRMSAAITLCCALCILKSANLGRLFKARPVMRLRRASNVNP